MHRPLSLGDHPSVRGQGPADPRDRLRRPRCADHWRRDARARGERVVQLRAQGDIHRIEIGARSNVQDGSVFHVEGPRPDTEGCPTIVGEDCVIGHMAVVHGATLEDRAFVGMGAVAMDDSRIGEGAMLAAGALLSPGKAIPRARSGSGGRRSSCARRTRPRSRRSASRPSATAPSRGATWRCSVAKPKIELPPRKRSRRWPTPRDASRCA